MANATFENHPTDPDKMILRKPRLDQGEDYERGFVDGMQMQVQRCVERNVLGTSCKRSEHWVGLTYEDMIEVWNKLYKERTDVMPLPTTFAKAIEAKLKEKNT